MFTVAQIIEAHKKVKSGKDFPTYIKEIKSLGVTQYEAYVSDGHIDYHGTGDYTATMPAKYDPILISAIPESEKFKAGLLAHQQGQTNFLTFIKMCAVSGIEKWSVHMDTMTCTYYDKIGSEVLIETIPQK